MNAEGQSRGNTQMTNWAEQVWRRFFNAKAQRRKEAEKHEGPKRGDRHLH